jgi:hypothetical protein
MKTKLIIIICLVCSFSAFAQDHKATSDSSSSSYKINTVFGCNHGGCKIPLGYFIEADAGYTRFGHHNVMLPGISMGLILDHHWSIGMTGSFIGNPQGLHFHHTYTDSTGQEEKKSRDLRGGYGGALFEYTLFPQSRIHVSFPLMVGCGYLYWSKVHYEDNNGTITNSCSHHYNCGDHFFVIEPGVKMEVNLAKAFRLGLGVSYRYAPDLDLKHAPDDLINQFTAKLSLRFGKF